MRIFIDSADLVEISAAARWGVLGGVTTNPSLMARAGVSDPGQAVVAIAGRVDGPVNVEVLATDAGGMIDEGRRYARWSPRVTVKIPMTAAGLEAVYQLNKEGISTNVTLVFSAAQGILAARAGATYISPFVGRLDDLAADGMRLIRELADIFRIHRIATEIIAASIRHPLHVVEAARAGAHIATVPFKVLEQMIRHPLTDAGIERFLADWGAVGASHRATASDRGSKRELRVPGATNAQETTIGEGAGQCKNVPH